MIPSNLPPRERAFPAIIVHVIMGLGCIAFQFAISASLYLGVLLHVPVLLVSMTNGPRDEISGQVGWTGERVGV
jgi:hypothetical protein